MILQEFTAAGTEVIMNAEEPAREALGSLNLAVPFFRTSLT
ncbi:hypothetical protein E2C01_054954 [Portunus trituberculatus]|uniref:Uncharacterized protein n=1 Tax=Portunus trituberculatus TaxID=210409 RepID=A0A5B7GWC4_PORTR|nr:hypothetical protein [Portunus trituberculatus]